MKKTLLFLLMTLTGLSMMAKPVEPEKAVQVAKNFMAQYVKGADKMEARVVYTHLMPKNGHPAMYAVNIGNMFVLISADDIAHPVLGYSTGRAWPTKQTLPSQVTAYLDDLAGQIEAATIGTKRAASASDNETATEWQQLLSLNSNLLTTTNLPDSVGPLLTTTWDQGQYYNALCPEDAAGPAGHCVTGCVATAMAQIINYWGYPVHGRGIHSYNSNYGALSVNYDSATYDYAHMPAVLTSTSTPQEVQAVATLMRDCGVAANMGYSPWESGAYDFDARAGLINFFQFSPSLSHAEKSYYSNLDWENMLHTEIADGRPIYYSGLGSGGHAFVCDGYKQNGFFHFNFGWSGYADGWYLTSAVNPAGMNFNSNQSAILGIWSDNTNNVILGQMTGNSTFTIYEPVEFYHVRGHNSFNGSDYINQCSCTTTFISANISEPLVLDVIQFENQSIGVYEGENSYGSPIQLLSVGSNFSPVVSTGNAMTLVYNGAFRKDGFRLRIGEVETCRLVSNINRTVEGNTVILQWAENGTATEWEVEYGESGFLPGEGVSQITNTPSLTVSGLAQLTKYDFYIRSLCGDGEVSEYNFATVKTSGSYWQDIITSEPASYTITDNIVEISTAEELTWWSKTDSEKSVVLMADIDLSGYLWRPVTDFGNSFVGNGHVIKHMTVDRPTASDVGFFADCYGNIEGVGMLDCHVIGSYRVGALCGRIRGNVYNCFARDCHIEGADEIGGLIGNNLGNIINSYAVNVTVLNGYVSGIMVGKMDGDLMQNCYSIGTLSYGGWYGSVLGYSHTGEMNHCYGGGINGGVIGHEGSTLFSDTSSIHYDGYSGEWTLSTPVLFDTIWDTSLLSALNRGVLMSNDERMRVWVEDTDNVNGGFPVLGDFYEVVCPDVSGLTIKNDIASGQNCVILSWNDTIGSEWEIRYQKEDWRVDSFAVIQTNSNPDTIYGLTLGETYSFGVRSVCGNDSISGWGKIIDEIVDLPLWTDVVTDCPNGYSEDSLGNVTISTKQGLAWLSLQCKQGNFYEGKTVELVKDIDLSGYRWLPIGISSPDDYYYTEFRGTFNGNNHTISNLYVHANKIRYAGLFGTTYRANVKNVSLDSGRVINKCLFNPDVIATGGLIGNAVETNIDNCHSAIAVFGYSNVGSLCGKVSNSETSIEIKNSSASGNVEGREGSGGLIGFIYGDITISNCFATGDVSMVVSGIMPWYVGGLVGNFMFASAYNCYSTGLVDINTGYSAKVIGCSYMNTNIHYVYGMADWAWTSVVGYNTGVMSNLSFFDRDSSVWTLSSPVTINNQQYFTLLEALNAWVIDKNEPQYLTWTIDSVGALSLPVFGARYEPTCYNPQNVSVTNATIIGDSIIRTRIAWEQADEPLRWEVRYVEREGNLDAGTSITVYSNPCVLDSLPTGIPLDFYVRAICDDSVKSGWSKPQTYIPDKLFWTDVVTSMPDGYIETGNSIYISTAEALAWMSTQWLYDKNIYLVNDLDLSEYRWHPIEHTSSSNFYGGRHKIRGLYCNDLASEQGLFGRASDCRIDNLILENCTIKGTGDVGAISGNSFGTNISNCLASGTISGYSAVGGLAGYHYYGTIKNSAFVGEVTSDPLYHTNDIQGYLGGICGIAFYDTLTNCYSASEITDTLDYSGIITGTGGIPDLVSYSYYRLYLTSLDITNGETNNVSSFSGNDTTWTLSSPSYINGVFYASLAGALNAWVDANNTNGQYRHWAADSANVNGGYPVFAAIPCTPATGSDSITVCDSYTWHGNVYTADATLIDTLSTLDGCDSIVTHYLTVNHSNSTYETDTACEAYFWDGEWRYSSGQYINTTTNAAGCDSIATLNLTINNPVNTATTVTACDSYTWQEAVITTSGTYHYTHTDTHGCTQDDTLYLTINHNDTVIVDEEVCDSLTWYGVTYTASAYGVQYLTVPNVVGCDSIFFLDLTVNYTTYGEMSAVSCDSYQWDWNGAVYTASGDYTYRDTVNMNSQFCDSVLTLHLTVNYSATSDTTATACDMFVWYGHMGYDVSGDYEHRWWNVTADGCDSILTLHLTINRSAETTVTDTAEGSYTWHDSTYTESGAYIWIGETTEGCDSTVTLVLTVTQVGIEDVEVGSSFNIFVSDGRIVVEGATGEEVSIFDMIGRQILREDINSSLFTLHSSLSAGVYLVKVGSLPARKVVVIR